MTFHSSLVWTTERVELLRGLYPDTPMSALVRLLGRSPRQIYDKAAKIGVRRSDSFLREHGGRIAPGDVRGIPHRFRKGHVPANKGQRRPGYAPGRMADTQFGKGNCPHNWHPVGTEILRGDGYLWVKVSDDRARPARFNWRQLHRLLWETHHGKIPPGFVVRFKDGNRENCRDINNLVLVSKKKNMLANSVHNLPEPLVEVIRLRGSLARTINRRMKK